MRYKATAALLFNAGLALSFQIQPNNGRCRHWRGNVVTRGKIRINAGSFEDDSRIASAAAAPPSIASAFEDMSEKFALPLVFKDQSSSIVDSKIDTATDKVDGTKSMKGTDDKTSFITLSKISADVSTDSSVADAAAAATTTTTTTTTSEPLTAAETNIAREVDEITEQAVGKEQRAPQQGETAPAPTTATTAAPFGPIVTPRRGFSDFGGIERKEPKIKMDDFREEALMKHTALGVNPDRNVEVKMEKEETIVQQQNTAPKKEVDTPTVTESKAIIKDTSKPVGSDEKSSMVIKPTPSSTEIAPYSTKSDLIQIQPSSPTLNIPEALRSVNLEDPSLILAGVVLIGLTLYFVLVQNMNKVDNTIDMEEERLDETNENKNLLQKVKDAGVAGAISYAFWELGFWGISIPVCVVGYEKFTGHWPDLSNSDDMKQLGAEIFTFANVARLAVPLRVGLALSTAPWVNDNMVQKFRKDTDAQQQEEVMEMVELQEQPYAEEGEYEYGDMEMDDGGYVQWVNELQQDEMVYGGEKNDFSQWSDVEERLSIIEETSNIEPVKIEENDFETKTSLPGNGYLNYIDEFCEAGTKSSKCAGAIKGYLDGLATTGAVASERGVATIVGYLDSLSSNTMPDGTSRTGAAFTSYLDALSSGNAPSPPSREAVANYLDELTATETRVVGIESRLNQLESSISNLPDDIAYRIIERQDSQDKKFSEELEKIKKMLEGVKSKD